MVWIRLPTGGREQLTGKRTFGRGIPESLSDPLISRQQFELDCVCEGVVQLTNIGLNPIIVERPSDAQPATVSLNLSGATTAASSSSWHVTDLLEQGDSACLQPNCRFYLASLQDSTMFTLISDSSNPAAEPADHDDLAAQQQQNQGSDHQSRADQEAADAALAAALAAEEREEDEQQQQWQDGSSEEGSGAADLAVAPLMPAAEAGAAVACDDDIRPAKRAKLSSNSGAAAGEQTSGAAAGASSSGATATASGTASAAAVPGVGSGPFSLLAVRGLSAAYNTGFLGAQLNQLVVSGAADSSTGTGGNRLVFALASNYMVDMGWLLSACPQLLTADKVLVVHGHSDHDRVASIISEAAAAGLTPPRFAQHAPPLPISFGTYHSKGFILGYEDGSVRVIIHTANYIYADCNNKTQGLWFQDFPPKDAESPRSSQFEESLLDYLSCLRLPGGWSSDVVSLVKGADFSAARVALVASVPGYHTGPTKVNAYGHMRLRALLSETSIPEQYKQAPCIIQCSSLGSLDERWLKQEFMASLTAGKYVSDEQTIAAAAAAAAGGGGVADTAGPQVSQRDSQSRATPSPVRSNSKKASTTAAASSSPAAAAGGGGVGGNAFAHMAAASRAQGAAGAVAGRPTVDVPLYIVWPSVSEVQHSREGWAAGYSIPGPAKNVTKPFLQRYWCRFDGSPVGRRSAMPHIKTYGRFLTHQQQQQATLHQSGAAAVGDPALDGQTAPGQSAAGVALTGGSTCSSGDPELCWWLVTSHNLSKAAWGSLQVCSRGPHRGQPQLMIRSYELGVMTTPQLEEAYLRHRHRSYSCTLPSHQTPAASSSLQPPGLQQEPDPQVLIPKVQFLAWNYPAASGIESAAAASSSSVKQVYLPVPYPLPPQRYSKDDKPWCVDVQFSGLDSFGFACGDAPFKAYGNKQPAD